MDKLTLFMLLNVVSSVMMCCCNCQMYAVVCFDHIHYVVSALL